MRHANSTDVLKVRAGDKIAFAHQRYEPDEWKSEHFLNCPEGRGTCNSPYIMEIPHWGPVIAHLSKVPEGQDVHEYDGAGEWVKIYTLGVVRREVPEPGNVLLWLPNNDGKLPPLVSLFFKNPRVEL
jgi:hypothetical protein